MEKLAEKNETASILPNSLLAYNSSFLTRGLVAEDEEYTLEDAIENLKVAIKELNQAIGDLNTKIEEVKELVDVKEAEKEVKDAKETKLEGEVASIKHDESITHVEKIEKLEELEADDDNDLQAIVDAAKKEVEEENKKRVEGILKEAKGYKYDDFEYTNELVIDGLTLDYTGKLADFNKGSGNTPATKDLARYLGALYRVNGEDAIKKIEFSGEEYNWNEDSQLKGSRWEASGKTLVAKIAEKIAGEIGKGSSELKLELKLDGVEVTLNVKITK